jgi:hypothetical protein
LSIVGLVNPQYGDDHFDFDATRACTLLQFSSS